MTVKPILIKQQIQTIDSNKNKSVILNSVKNQNTIHTQLLFFTHVG